MATRVDIQRDGNGNGALNESLLATDPEKRLAYAHPIIRSILTTDGPQILRDADHTESAIAYMSPVFNFLGSKPISENNGRSWVFRGQGDSLGSRRFIEYNTPQTRLVRVEIDRASDGYIRAGDHEAEGSLEELTQMMDGSGPRTLARFLLVSTELYRDDKNLAEALSGVEFPPSKLAKYLNPVSGLLTAIHIPTPTDFRREDTAAGKDVLMRVGYSKNRQSVQRWREAISDSQTTLLAKVHTTDK